jgi:hypothetical protein
MLDWYRYYILTRGTVHTFPFPHPFSDKTLRVLQSINSSSGLGPGFSSARISKAPPPSHPGPTLRTWWAIDNSHKLSIRREWGFFQGFDLYWTGFHSLLTSVMPTTWITNQYFIFNRMNPWKKKVNKYNQHEISLQYRRKVWLELLLQGNLSVTMVFLNSLSFSI